MNHGGHPLTAIRIGDEPAAWTAAGFAVDHLQTQIGRVGVQLVGSTGHRGVLSLAITGIDTPIDGIAVHHDAAEWVDPADTTVHPNGVTRIDHIVVKTPDCDRTTAALASAGIESRRVRRFEVDGATRRQTFFWIGDVILELVGPDTAHGAQPATIWGLALSSADLDETAVFLGTAGGRPKPALQTGRRILTVKTKDLGISTAIAFMSPHDLSQGR